MQQATSTQSSPKTYTEDEVDAIVAAKEQEHQTALAEQERLIQQLITDFYADKLADLGLSPLPG